MTDELTRAYELVLDDLEHRIENAFERALRRVLSDPAVSLSTIVNNSAAATHPSRLPELKVVPPATFASGWVTVDSANFMSGRNHRTIVKGTKVKVRGLGRGGGIGDGFVVERIQQRGDDVNVDVQKGRGSVIRTVRLDAIIWKRQNAHGHS